jgi:short-subunit dehydrogenase
MLKQNTECYIVNTASVAGLIGGASNDPYIVSKHGVVALSEALYRELPMLGNKKIGVSVLCPGVINTNILDSTRNRPANLRNAPGEETMDMSDPKVQAMMRYIKQIFEKGMSPQEVADIVFNAIKEKSFTFCLMQKFINPRCTRGWKILIKSAIQPRYKSTISKPFFGLLVAW